MPIIQFVFGVIMMALGAFIICQLTGLNGYITPEIMPNAVLVLFLAFVLFLGGAFTSIYSIPSTN